jgi:hypothetical protein
VKPASGSRTRREPGGSLPLVLFALVLILSVDYHLIAFHSAPPARRPIASDKSPAAKTAPATSTNAVTAARRLSAAKTA